MGYRCGCDQGGKKGQPARSIHTAGRDCERRRHQNNARRQRESKRADHSPELRNTDRDSREEESQREGDKEGRETGRGKEKQRRESKRD